MLRFLRARAGSASPCSRSLVVGVCVRLGMWQLDRLEGRREFNARYAAGLEAAPGRSRTCWPTAARSRTGARSRPDASTPSTRSSSTAAALDGQAGNHVLTPARARRRACDHRRSRVGAVRDRRASGRRGRAADRARSRCEGPCSPPQPGGAGEVQPGEDRVTTVRTVDVEAIARDLPYDVVPWFLQLQTQSPPAGDLPCPNRLPSSRKARTSATRSSGSCSRRSRSWAT